MSRPTQMNRLEGNGASRIIQMMKQIGYNEEVKFHITEVRSVVPFSIRLIGDDFDIPDEMIFINQSILPHVRKVDLNGTATFNGVTDTLNATDMQVTFKDDYIKPGDEVFTIETHDGQRFWVIDKVV